MKNLCNHIDLAYFRKIALYAVFLLTILSTQSTLSDPLQHTDTTSPPITVLTEQLYPLSYTHNGEDNGVIKGHATQLVKALLEEAKIEYTINVVPWSRAVHMLNNQKNTLVFSVARTPERENLYHWIGKIIPMKIYLFGLKSKEQALPTTLEEARSYRIGTSRNGTTSRYLKSLEFPFIIEVASQNQYRKMLERNRIDLAPSISFLFDSWASRQGVDPKDFVTALELPEISRSLEIAMNINSDPVLVENLKQAYIRLEADGKLDQMLIPLRALVD